MNGPVRYTRRMAHIPLDEMLKKARMSRRKFAAHIGVDYKNIARLFKPEYDPKLSTMKRWAKALHCKVRDLIRED